MSRTPAQFIVAVPLHYEEFGAEARDNQLGDCVAQLRRHLCLDWRGGRKGRRFGGFEPVELALGFHLPRLPLQKIAGA
jgi:hypothetical protein